MDRGSKWQHILTRLFQPISKYEQMIVLQWKVSLLNEWANIEKENKPMLRKQITIGTIKKVIATFATKLAHQVRRWKGLKWSIQNKWRQYNNWFKSALWPQIMAIVKKYGTLHFLKIAYKKLGYPNVHKKLHRFSL